jgi:chemotaxis protein MotB
MVRLEPKELESRLELSEQKRVQLQKKLTQKTVDEEIPLWSMVDLMTLLLIFFLFFYTTAVKGSWSAPQDSAEDSAGVQIASSAFYQKKAEEKPLIATYQTPASGSSLRGENDSPEQTVAPLREEVFENPEQTIEQPREEALEAPQQTIEQLREEVLETMDKGDQDVFSVSSGQHRLAFVLGERITFKEGEATLLESYHPIFVRIAGFISSKPQYQVVVSGHTDNKPIKTEKFPSNLELSSVRAITVAKFLIENGVAPQRVSVQGFSEYRPLFENSSPENRQKNRRVEIALIKDQDGDNIN